MKFENEFTVQAPIEQVWRTLLDVERVAPCMPGAEVLERTGENAYKVGIKVKVGPISMLYRGQVEITERDDASHEATMRAKAREARGQGTADAHLHMGLVEQAGGAHATIATDLQLSGRAAAMGRGVIGDVAAKLVETFAGNLAEMLAGPAAPAAEAAVGNGAPAPAVQPPEPVAESAAPAVEAPTPSGEPVATAAETPAPATGETPPPPRATRPSSKPGGESLPVGQIAASVIAGRLKNPRTLLIATGALGLAFGAIGYAIGRSR